MPGFSAAVVFRAERIGSACCIQQGADCEEGSWSKEPIKTIVLPF
jgi:hypothetical protein